MTTSKLVRAYADMYYCCDIIGAVDCSKLYEPNVWLTAMMRESEAPQPFCSASFKAWADSMHSQTKQYLPGEHYCCMLS